MGVLMYLRSQRPQADDPDSAETPFVRWKAAPPEHEGVPLRGLMVAGFGAALFWTAVYLLIR